MTTFGKVNFKIHFILTIVFLAPLASILAQSKTAPFEKIRVHFAYQLNANQNYFNNYWSNNDAFQVELETPFYLGEFSMGLRYAEFSDIKEKVPAFKNYQLAVGWQVRGELLQRVVLRAGIGTVFSMYYYEEISEEQWRWVKSGMGSVSPENEAGFTYTADISYEFISSWGVRLSLNHSRIYTRKRIEHSYLGLGLYKEFKTPKIIHEFLK